METTRMIVDIMDVNNDIRSMLPEGHEVFDVRYLDSDPEICKSYETIVEVDHGHERDCWEQWVANIHGVTLTLAK